MAVATLSAVNVLSAMNVAVPSRSLNLKSNFVQVAGLKATAQKTSVVSSRRRFSIRMEAGPTTGSTLVGEGTAPLSGTTVTAPIGQKDVPVAERIAYICNDCGYIYDQETPFEEVDDATFNCPVCKAPKNRFTMQNTTVGESKEGNEDL
eukprot:TRINITY_DN32513_c0_g1_i1.p3 TRINITY_DN32513_c0_g1~~TRINITY_DN32513_c0_g1_i1.p3  ORF type:complete len:149 (-),score=28.95 TRINITY_DN32513_c0_g1_i1:629-1075(-)